MKRIAAATFMCIVVSALTLGGGLFAPRTSAGAAEAQQSELSLITSTPQEGFDLAVRLARMGVATTQPDREVLFQQRPEYAADAASLIAASHVVAVHFQTIAAANDYWR